MIYLFRSERVKYRINLVGNFFLFQKITNFPCIHFTKLHSSNVVYTEGTCINFAGTNFMCLKDFNSFTTD